jgi:hypothetical protein
MLEKRSGEHDASAHCWVASAHWQIPSRSDKPTAGKQRANVLSADGITLNNNNLCEISGDTMLSTVRLFGCLDSFLLPGSLWLKTTRFGLVLCYLCCFTASGRTLTGRPEMVRTVSTLEENICSRGLWLALNSKKCWWCG